MNWRALWGLLSFYYKRSNYIWIYLFSCGGFFVVYFLFAAENKHTSKQCATFLQPKIDKEQVKSWVRKIEELKWFAAAEPSKTSFQDMPSQIAFEQSIPSFDRIYMAVKTLDVILEGRYEDYLEFISSQPKQSRLSWNQFQELQLQAATLFSAYPKLNFSQMREVIELGIIYSEIGNTDVAKRKAWVYEITFEDHIDFIEKVIKTHPDVFPTYAKLDPQQRDLLETILTTARFIEITRLNKGMEFFESVKKSNLVVKSPDTFDLALFLHICNLAGSMGNENAYSSPTLTVHAMKNIVFLRKAFHLLKEKTPLEAQHYYLTTRASWLGFDPESPLNRILTRIGAMMNLYTLAEGKALRDAFLKLDPAALTIVVNKFEELEKAPSSKEFSEIASFLLIMKEKTTLGATEKERLTSCIQIGFPFMAKVFEQRKSQPTSDPLDFSQIIEVAIHNPDFLSLGKIHFDDKGRVILVME